MNDLNLFNNLKKSNEIETNDDCENVLIDQDWNDLLNNDTEVCTDIVLELIINDDLNKKTTFFDFISIEFIELFISSAIVSIIIFFSIVFILMVYSIFNETLQVFTLNNKVNSLNYLFKRLLFVIFYIKIKKYHFTLKYWKKKYTKRVILSKWNRNKSKKTATMYTSLKNKIKNYFNKTKHN